MKKMMLFAIVALVMTACNGSSNNKPGDQQPAQVFVAMNPEYVLSNQDGSKFLLFDYQTENPEMLNNYEFIFYKGEYYPVVYKGHQDSDPENDMGSDSYFNFDYHEGYLFEMKEGKLLTDPEDEYDAIYASPLLVDKAFKESVKIVSQDFWGDNVPQEVEAQLEQQFDRKLVWARTDYKFGENLEYQFICAQFENKGDQALALIGVVMPDGSLRLKEFPAEWNEYSVWRVDDEGEFNGYWLDLITVENGVLTLYACNSGAEGSNYQAFVVTDEGLSEGTVAKSFYQAGI